MYTPYNSLGDLILNKCQQYRDRIAVVCTDTRREQTYGDLFCTVVHLSTALKGRGLKKGDVVSIVCSNSPQFTHFCLAALCAGGVVSTANPSFTADEITKQFRSSKTKFVLCDEDIASKTKVAVTRCSLVQEVFVNGRSPGCTSLSALFDHSIKGHDYEQLKFDVKSDIALLPFSSGTTGTPKGVMLTHHNVVSNLFQFSEAPIETQREKHAQEVYILNLPIFHVFGMATLQLYGLFKGHKLVYMRKFNLVKYLEAIQTYKATMLHLVPPVALGMLNHPAISSYDLSSVQLAYCGAAPLSRETEQTFCKNTRIGTFTQGYGMTEAGPVLSASPFVGYKSGSVGPALPDTEVKVVDSQTGATLGARQHGELCFRGPQIMKGYLDQSSQTHNAIDAAGFLHTGDIGYVDEEGHIYVVDRVKEIIKYKAFQVSPAELEAVLLGHPAVQDAAVLGTPHPAAGELPTAAVVRRDGQRVTEAELVDYLAERVAPYKRLRGGVKFIKAIPKSPSGKILRRVLKEQIQKSLFRAKL